MRTARFSFAVLARAASFAVLARAASGIVLAFALVGCPSKPPARPAPEPTPTSTLTPEGEAFLAGCTCEQLNAPVTVPTDATELARWERVRSALDIVFAELAPLVPDGRCGPTTAGEVTRILDAHAATLREGQALDAASCDHFTRWHTERSGSVGIGITQAMRGGCELSRESTEQLSALLVTRGCTVTN